LPQIRISPTSHVKTKPRDALKSILQIRHPETNNNNLSHIRDPETGRITNDTAIITAMIERLETKLLSPDIHINPLESFPWLNAIPAGPPPNQHMIIGKITPAIFQEALPQLPSHKAPDPDNIP
jgi:hypothetical protein